MPEPLVGARHAAARPARGVSPRAPGRGGIRRRLDVFERIDGGRGSSAAARNTSVAGLAAGESGLGFRDAARAGLGAADADTRLDDDAVLQRYVASAIAMAKSPARRLNS